MGYGDYVMASAQVREANIRTGKKVMLGDGHKYYFDEQVFSHNPRMAKPGDPCVWVANYGGNRPYIKGSENKHFIFNDDFKPVPGEVFFSDKEFEWRDEHAPESPYIVIEPTVKNRFAHGVNKSWPYWKMLVDEDLPFVQLGPDPCTLFPHIETKTFRQAMLILSRAKMFVGTDGGLHHAAAALDRPAVVIWTGFSSPKHLGYDTHINLHDGSEPCGDYSGPCPHCAEKAAAISPSQVLEAIRRLL